MQFACGFTLLRGFANCPFVERCKGNRCRRISDGDPNYYSQNLSLTIGFLWSPEPDTELDSTSLNNSKFFHEPHLRMFPEVYVQFYKQNFTDSSNGEMNEFTMWSSLGTCEIARSNGVCSKDMSPLSRVHHKRKFLWICPRYGGELYSYVLPMNDGCFNLMLNISNKCFEPLFSLCKLSLLSKISPS
ncbi:uncharacterized protein LOC104445422 isoform X2 [Eucalyptus grandis]|uniref:uncharacterized protein LOC104445422 isoform X2 n=1 Tax=Eucalyptus grandis TaxID=71139 RepID=UPI00192ED094|nr:uncharacterized protein LOC104445422 isoform X2 [Eucalyptus grandis]